MLQNLFKFNATTGKESSFIYLIVDLIQDLIVGQKFLFWWWGILLWGEGVKGVGVGET